MNKKAKAWVWIIVALIIVIGAIVVTFIIMQGQAEIAASQPKPIWYK